MIKLYHNYKFINFPKIYLPKKKAHKSTFVMKAIYFLAFYLLTGYNLDILYDYIYYNKYAENEIKKIKNERLSVENIIRFRNSPENNPIKHFSQF